MKPLPRQMNKNGASNYIFGVNTPNYDSALLTNSNVQTQMKAAGVSVIRTALNSASGAPYSDAQLDQLATAISNTGAAMLAILPHAQPTFIAHAVAYLGDRCMMYEYSNERDINGESWQQYLSEWNTLIPLARQHNPNAAYIGPVLGVFSNVDSYLMPWLQGCKSSGVLPDAISFHIYPCTGGSIPQSVCISRAVGIGSSGAQLRTKIHNVLGYDLPLCLTEWNADAYYATPQPKGQGYNSNANANDAFNRQFVIDAIEGFIANSIDMACLFELSYFLANKNGPTSTTAQYMALASEYQKYFSGVAPTPPPIPVPNPVPPPGPAIATTPTTFYLANATSATLSGASQLYTKPGTPPTTWHYTRIGTAHGYGELCSQGTLNSWPALSAIGAPTGRGSFYDDSLSGRIIEGNWTANIRLNCAQNGDAHVEAGTLIADLVIRAFKYNRTNKIYTLIAEMTTKAQHIPPSYTTYPLSGSGMETRFKDDEFLYVDRWANVIQNANNNPEQDFRLNRLSIETAGKTGDSATAIICPGFAPVPNR